MLSSASSSFAPFIVLSIHLVANALIGGFNAEHVDEKFVQSDYGQELDILPRIMRVFALVEILKEHLKEDHAEEESAPEE